MAEKTQQTFLNGTPPQLVSSDPIPHPQSSYMQTTQANYPGSQGQDQNQYPKRAGLMVNGQLPSMIGRNPNVYQHAVQTGNVPNDTTENRIPNPSAYSSQVFENSSPSAHANVPPSQFQKSSYVNNPVSGQQQLPPQYKIGEPQATAGTATSSLNPYSNIQSNAHQQPSPQLGSKLNANASGNSQLMQPVANSQVGPPLLPQAQYQQGNRGNLIQQNPLPSPYPAPGLSRPGPPRAAAAAAAPVDLSNPPSYDSSPYNKPPILNAGTRKNSLSGTNPSPLHQMSSQGSQASPPFAGPNQPFPPYSNQPGFQANRWPGTPHGYQPVGAPPANQPPRMATPSNLNSSVPPPVGQSNAIQNVSMGYNQITPNRTAVGPPSSMPGDPPVVPIPRGPVPPVNHMPPPPVMHGSSKYPSVNALAQNMEKMSVSKHGFNKMWGLESIDLLQCRNVLPPQKVTPPPIRLHQEFMDNVNCSPEIFCCTLNKIPETNSLLQKSRLPLGILIHPFRDLNQLATIQCSSIVRCRACRTYINPFVYFVDNKRWKCNLCFRINELPDEFQYDPVSKTYGDPSRRPEVRNSTIEFIAPSEYMLRPPQPAIYLFVLDVSRNGCDSGYLETLCSVLLDELDNLPGDCRTQIGFILFDSYVHFFSMAENYTQAHEMIVTDINDVFLPTPDSLLVNLNENKQLVRDLLQELPRKYCESFDTGSALGAALQAGYKLMAPTGGRITVFQSCLPNVGPGSLSSREDPNQRSAKDVRHLGPQTDFYKRLSLDCSTQQISVDLFLVSSQYSDLATIGGISQFSAGCIYYFPLFRKSDVDTNERLIRALRRYLTRKIGFEAVMRVRCSRGLAIHTFHGNFFVRSTDLLSLPNVNPDAGFGMQVAIEESLCELQTVCFQAAVLYTSAKGERRIRVHTLCLPVSSNLSDILTSADQQAIIGLLGKLAVDRSLKSSLSDAREAFINVAIDVLSAYKLVETSGGPNAVLAPFNLSLIPLYILALLKSTAFRTGQSTRLDDRVFAMLQMKTLPLRELIQLIHPDLYNVTELDDQTEVEFEDKTVAQPPRLSLSSEHLDSRGIFLLDTPDIIYILFGRNVERKYLHNLLDVSDISQISNDVVDLPELDTEESEKLGHFINYLQSEKSWPAIVKVVVEPQNWQSFLVNDKAENALSYYELLHHVKAQLK